MIPLQADPYPAGEVGRAPGRRSLRCPDLVYCCILEDNFLVNIFLILKEDAITTKVSTPLP